MRRGTAATALVAAILGASCSGAPLPTTQASSPTASNQPLPDDAQVADARPFDPTIRGMITATGIPVQVLSIDGSTAVVRTPCDAEATVSSWQPLTAVDVVLDPGHGGRLDTGAVAEPSHEAESHLNLRVVQAIGLELETRGITWVSTRSGDYPLLLSVRAAFADAMAAKLMVSVHHNAPVSAASDIPGTEVYIQSGSPESSRLGGLLHDHVVAALSSFDVNWVRSHDAGVMQVLISKGDDAYGVLLRPTTPTVLLEAGYLANPEEAALFATDRYLETMGTAVADAIQTYLETDQAPVQQPGPARRFSGVRAPSTASCVETPLEP